MVILIGPTLSDNEGTSFVWHSSQNLLPQSNHKNFRQTQIESHFTKYLINEGSLKVTKVYIRK